MKKSSIVILALSIAFFSCTKKNKAVILSTTHDIHNIDACRARDLINEFKKNYANDADVSRSVWFEYAEVHKLDSLLKHEMDSISADNIKRGIDPSYTTDGIRIYFARHLKNDANPDLKGRNTVLIIATKDTLDPQYPGKTMHKDYYPACKPHLMPQDNGEVCPIHCQGATLQ